jgi:hypothetical protein
VRPRPDVFRIARQAWFTRDLLGLPLLTVRSGWTATQPSLRETIRLRSPTGYAYDTRAGHVPERGVRDARYPGGLACATARAGMVANR